LAQSHPEIEEIWLFGSLARREATPASDADIVLVLSHSSLPFLERPPHYAFDDCGVATDLLAYTHAEMERMRAEENPFLRQIEGERCILWRRGRRIGGRA
jgi:predicted nucleotidyltransferase